MLPALLVLGTRPEAVKLAPVARALRAAGWPYGVANTGQSPDLFEWPLDDFAWLLRVPNDNDPPAFVARTQAALAEHFPFKRLVIVQGDTASACGGAEFAHHKGLPLVHVEAGLRTFDASDPYPEELFRKRIDHLATYRFPPTQQAAQNLAAEGLPHHGVTGNTGIDAIADQPVVAPEDRLPIVWVTLHRRENRGERIEHILDALRKAADRNPSLSFVVVRHPNNAIPPDLPDSGNVRFRTPLPPEVFRRCVAWARAVVTDSGGLVEECAWLGTPCCIARRKTERPEAVEAGAAVMGSPVSGASVLAGIERALAMQPGRRSSVFGSGGASETIVQTLEYAVKGIVHA